jgi:4-amino-4-deoxy-L-arabinose transferase-like glycosyltransferase
MVATEPHLAMVWDEGHVLGREARIRLWVRALANPPAFAASWKPPLPLEEWIEDSPPPHNVPPPRAEEINTRSKLLSPRVMAWFWPFAREEPHGHPPFYALVGLIGDVVAPWLADLPRARVGPMLVFSLVAGAIFSASARRWGMWAAFLSTGAWVVQPQLFAMGHYAGYDALLAGLWVVAILSFSDAVENPPRSRVWMSLLVFSLACGFAADTKLTGWFLPLPFIAFTLFTRSLRGIAVLSVAGSVAIVTLYVFNPAWWFDPVAGLTRFFQSNLSRGEKIRIPVLFLGKVYSTPDGSLPWYNTLVWTVFASPVGFLLLGGIGVFFAVKNRRSGDPLAILSVMNWGFLLILRALPHTPGHDGVRQFIPAFGCLAITAGVGANAVVSRFGRWGKVLVAAALVEGVASVALIMPVPLSYFSPIVGGLPGATKLGMEPTYFWDALSTDALQTLARETPEGRSVRFATFPTSWLYLQKTGAITFPLSPISRARPAWYVVQNRPGALQWIDRVLIARTGPRHVLVEKFGVPLVWAFPYDEVEAFSRSSTAPSTIP